MRRSHFDNAVARVTRGALAGLAATVVLRALRRSMQHRVPEGTPPMRAEPGPEMVERLEGALPEEMQERIPPRAEAAAARTLAFGYGATLAVLYALARPRGGDILRDGIVLGFGAWGIAYLGWLPALGMSPSVARMKPLQVAVPVLQHTVYGLAATGAYEGLRRVQRRM
ncbi:MAG TPA: hypothetical protein VFK13_01120 [Gemmatimonadaceae bacterium]|nr:hypothetical protein [Gemmatimonadaceae bacterium]